MTTQDTTITADERKWGMISHLVAAVFAIVGALVIWFMHKDKPGFVRDQATEALNFQVLVFGVEVVAVILAVFVPLLSLLASVAWLAGVVFAVLGALTVNKGQPYEYPFGLRIVK
ncbi:MAG: DUF4870 domain-containing protein [Micrococcales bacterium]|nr:DUF4870 domain-containing protein [Micrococcales bacterium]